MSFLSGTHPFRARQLSWSSMVKAHTPYHSQQGAFLALRNLQGILDHRLLLQKICLNAAQTETPPSQLNCHRRAKRSTPALAQKSQLYGDVVPNLPGFLFRSISC